MSGQCADHNGFPQGQCTWWACERYHQMTGCYAPFNADAGGWSALASSYGWHMSATPPVGIPSICVLQPGVQYASSLFGHVAVVERIIGSSVDTSNLNWSPNPGQVTHVTFKEGPGVSFVWNEGGTIPSSGTSIAGSVGSVTGDGNSSSTTTADPGSTTTATTSLATSLGLPDIFTLPARAVKLGVGFLFLLAAFLMFLAPIVAPYVKPMAKAGLNTALEGAIAA